MKKMLTKQMVLVICLSMELSLYLCGCSDRQFSQEIQSSIDSDAKKIAGLVDETSHFKSDCSLNI